MRSFGWSFTCSTPVLSLALVSTKIMLYLFVEHKNHHKRKMIKNFESYLSNEEKKPFCPFFCLLHPHLPPPTAVAFVADLQQIELFAKWDDEQSMVTQRNHVAKGLPKACCHSPEVSQSCHHCISPPPAANHRSGFRIIEHFASFCPLRPYTKI